MLLKTIFVLYVISACFGDFYDEIVLKDEEARKIFLEPRGCKDTDMFNAMRYVGDAYGLVTKHLQIRNQSSLDFAKKLRERGPPVLLSECFSTDNLKVTFNWGDGDLRYFNFLYEDVNKKWTMFDQMYVNVTLNP